MLPYGYVKIAIENNQDQQDHFANLFPRRRSGRWHMMAPRSSLEMAPEYWSLL